MLIGETTVIPVLNKLPPRFWNKIELHPNGDCWQWKAGKTLGYGRFWLDGRTRNVHTLIYEAFYGPVPEGFQVDHLCRVTDCLKPGHLEAVTPRTNVLRSLNLAAQNAAKTHCPKGHLLAGDNLRKSDLDLYGHRNCRICRNENQRQRRLRKSRS
jgi:hypothetical protein